MQEEIKVALSFSEITKKVGLSKATISRLEKVNLFPRRVRVGEKNVIWFEDEIEEWIEKRSSV